MSLVWYLCDLKSGDVWADLPLRATGDIERTVGTATTVGVELDVHDGRCPANWAILIDPRRAMFVIVDDDIPVAGYFIDQDEAGEPSAKFTLTSLEGIPEYAYVRTHDFFQGVDDEATALATLFNDVIGPKFGFTVVATPTGQTADHSYLFEEDRTVASAAQDLMSALGGPEWTIRLAWADGTHRRIVKTIYVAGTIGATIASTVFENNHLAQRLRKRSSARGNRATHVIAVSDGSGDGRPMSAAYVDQDALDAGVPQWEARLATTAVDDAAQLDRIAEAGLEKRRQGITTWEMQLALSEPGCPRLIRDFDAGDTVTIQSVATSHDPYSWNGLARVIGWRASIVGNKFSTVTPVFWDPDQEASV